MIKRNRLPVTIIAAIILLACACPATSLPIINNNQPPTSIQPATSIAILPTHPDIPTIQPPSSTILLQDDFSVESSEMETFSDDTGSVETKDGAYVVRSITELWNWGRSKSEFDNTVTEFDVTMATGPGNNNAGFGLICRMHTRDDNSIDGYLLAISGDGFYSIRRITSGSMEPLVDWTFSNTVNQGTLSNKIRATCNGSELKLEVNGELLATANADANGPQSGGFAFAVVSFEASERVAEVQFDNLVVSKP